MASTAVNGEHCVDNVRDRAIGEYWEREFCKMASQYNKTFTPMQIGRAKSAQAYGMVNGKWNNYTLPDVTIWTFPGEHHEIKHKNPTDRGCFGLEQYRFDALRWFASETSQQVMYTIHNHDLSGGKDSTVNNINHWVTANVIALDGNWTGTNWGYSWVGGIKKRVPIHYWDASLWIKLNQFWDDQLAPF